MSTSQQQLVCDSSTFANFNQWASAISAFFATSTWAQSNDTGQVMWSGMSITACASGSGNGVYTYNSLTGLALAVGRAVAITGMTNAANNGTFVITAFTGTTFTVVNASAVTESGSAGVVTKVTTVPGLSAYVYEIWKPNDGLTNFYVKVEYGNASGTTNCPTVRITLSTTTNGAGTCTGFVTAAWATNYSSFTAPSTTTQYECNFSGAAGRMGAMLWRNGGNSCQQFFGIERSVDATGAYTGTYATFWVVGISGGQALLQQTLHFTAGVAPSQDNNGTRNTNFFSAPIRLWWNAQVARSSAFNGSIPFDTFAPVVGFFDYQCTTAGLACSQDISEGVTFTATLYGATRTYMPSKNGSFGGFYGASGPGAAFCMRYD